MDAYVFALRLPNFFRNLMAEGALSASLTPILAALVGAKNTKDVQRVARGSLALVGIAALGLSIAGMLAAPWLARFVAPGFDSDQQLLASRLVQITFPMAGMMILGAWCMSVLNSHRWFFVPQAAPALWNLAQIAGVLVGARMGWEPLVVVLAWSTLVGSALQLLVQFVPARRLLGWIRPRIERGYQPIQEAVRRAGPAAAGQGLYQVSGLVDAALASFLLSGALSALYFAQRIAQLPLAVVGAAVTQAALTEMSREKDPAKLASHLEGASQKILWFTIPAAAAVIAGGDLIASAIFQRGAFTSSDARDVHVILAASALSILAGPMAKLLAASFHSQGNTAIPLRCAAWGLGTGVAVGASLMFFLESAGWGVRAAAGLVGGGGVGASVQVALLARTLKSREFPSWRPRGQTVLRMALAAVCLGAAFWFTGTVLGAVADTGWERVALVAMAGVVGGGVYVGIAGTRVPKALLRGEHLAGGPARVPNGADGAADDQDGKRRGGPPRRGGRRHQGSGGPAPMPKRKRRRVRARWTK